MLAIRPSNLDLFQRESTQTVTLGFDHVIPPPLPENFDQEASAIPGEDDPQKRGEKPNKNRISVVQAHKEHIRHDFAYEVPGTRYFPFLFLLNLYPA